MKGGRRHVGVFRVEAKDRESYTQSTEISAQEMWPDITEQDQNVCVVLLTCMQTRMHAHARVDAHMHANTHTEPIYETHLPVTCRDSDRCSECDTVRQDSDLLGRACWRHRETARRLTQKSINKNARYRWLLTNARIIKSTWHQTQISTSWSSQEVSERMMTCHSLAYIWVNVKTLYNESAHSKSVGRYSETERKYFCTECGTIIVHTWKTNHKVSSV